MAELRIPLPESSDGNAPVDISFRWCQELHKALQPLVQYKLADGSDAVVIHVVSSPEETVLLFHPWTTEHGRGGLTFSNPKIVMLVELRNANFCTIVRIYFFVNDFAGDAKAAKEKFAQIIRHLEDHAVPQVAPEWISKALSALSSK